MRAASGHVAPGTGHVLLGDTLGELRNFYALATVIFVGRSLWWTWARSSTGRT